MIVARCHVHIVSHLPEIGFYGFVCIQCMGAACVMILEVLLKRRRRKKNVIEMELSVFCLLVAQCGACLVDWNQAKISNENGKSRVCTALPFHLYESFKWHDGPWHLFRWLCTVQWGHTNPTQIMS